MMTQREIIAQAIQNSLSYSEYRELTATLLASGKTTGLDQSEAMLEYASLNETRMAKWDKHFTPDPEVKQLMKQLEKKEIWLVITEGWCGDAAHAVPVMNHLAEASAAVELRLVLRDENPVLMDAFLTNGKRNIPKLIRLNPETLEVLGTWGPQPKEALELVSELKSAGQPVQEVKKSLQLWYGRNRGKAIESELAVLLAQVVFS